MPGPEFKRLQGYLFAGFRGSENRIRIIDFLKERLQNMNQLEGIGFKFFRISRDVTELTLFSAYYITSLQGYGISLGSIKKKPEPPFFPPEREEVRIMPAIERYQDGG